MFLRRTTEDAKAKAPSHLHPWVMKADQDSRLFRANPDRPRVWVKTDEGIVPIADSSPGKLQRGDTVAVSFTVTYHKTMANWFLQFHPADIVLLRAGDSTDYGAPALDLYSRPPPSFDQSLEVEGKCYIFVTKDAHILTGTLDDVVDRARRHGRQTSSPSRP